jgi:hypothetical protein
MTPFRKLLENELRCQVMLKTRCPYERVIMAGRSLAFERTYKEYLEQVAKIDVRSIKEKLGVRVKGNATIIPLFGKPIRVSSRGIIDESGQRPSFDICVILCKYLLLCPDSIPKETEWVAYRDFNNAGPLTVYFANDVERSIAARFSGRIRELETAGKALGGSRPEINISNDLSMRFEALPRVSLLMLYNDADEEFPAQCSVLFEKRAERYLDAECLAMVGRLLFTNLETAAGGMLIRR